MTAPPINDFPFLPFDTSVQKRLFLVAPLLFKGMDENGLAGGAPSSMKGKGEGERMDGTDDPTSEVVLPFVRH